MDRGEEGEGQGLSERGSRETVGARRVIGGSNSSESSVDGERAGPSSRSSRLRVVGVHVETKFRRE